MKKHFFVLLLLSTCFSISIRAAEINDASIIQVKSNPSGHEVEFQAHYKNKKVQFLVEITKDDPEAFEKLGLLLKKVSRPKNYRIDLDIPSFSHTRNGSFYKSSFVKIKEHPLSD